ncbi:hypothetical protein [Erythrobacter donghaensis]|jgi:hypothetical protein|nr:hypothetical protein [Erythrobacter donghaensis]
MATGFVVMLVAGSIALFLGGTYRAGQEHLPLTFRVVLEAALFGSVFLGLFGALMTLPKRHSVIKKSNDND